MCYKVTGMKTSHRHSVKQGPCRKKAVCDHVIEVCPVNLFAQMDWIEVMLTNSSSREIFKVLIFTRVLFMTSFCCLLYRLIIQLIWTNVITWKFACVKILGKYCQVAHSFSYMLVCLFFLYEPYYFNYFYDFIALSFAPQGQGVKAVNLVKCLCLHCIQIVFRRPILNQTPIVVETMRDRSCSLEFTG